MKEERRIYPELRKCGYDPSGDMIQVSGGRGEPDPEQRHYLEVKYRVFWFNRWCEENNKVGVIDCSEHREEPLMPGVSVTAKIYVDGVLWGCAAAGETYLSGDPVHNARAIQTAGTRALGKALANAGFGTIASGEITEEETSLNPVQNTPVMRVPASAAEREPVNPEVPEDKNRAASGDEELEQARAVPVTIGKYRGRTLGEIAAQDFRIVQWYASDSFDTAGRHREIKKAAKIIVEHFSGAA